MGDLRRGRGTRGTFFPFLIQDKTPRTQRVYPQGKPVTKEFRGVTRVVIAVRNLDDAIKRYHEAFGEPPPIKQADPSFGAYLALLGNLPVVLAQPLNADSWLNERIERFGEGPVRLRARRRESWPFSSGVEDTLVRRRGFLVRRGETRLAPRFRSGTIVNTPVLKGLGRTKVFVYKCLLY